MSSERLTILALVLASLYLCANGQPFEPLGTFCSNEGEIRIAHNSCGSGEHGVLQVCEMLAFTLELRWRYVGINNWSTQKTKLACRELGLNQESAEWDSVTLTEFVQTRELRAGECTGTIHSCVVPIHFPVTDQVLRINCIEPATEAEATTMTTQSPTTKLPTTEATTTQQALTTDRDSTTVYIGQAPIVCNCPTSDDESTPTPSTMRIDTTESSDNLSGVCQQSVSNAVLLVFMLTLAVALIIVSIGWILSCVYFRKTFNRKILTDRRSNIEGALQIQLHNSLNTNTEAPRADNSHLYDIIPIKLHNNGDGGSKYDTLTRKSLNEREDSLDDTYHVLEASPLSSEPQYKYDTLTRKSLEEKEIENDTYHVLETSPLTTTEAQYRYDTLARKSLEENEVGNDTAYHILESSPLTTTEAQYKYDTLARKLVEEKEVIDNNTYHVLEPSPPQLTTEPQKGYHKLDIRTMNECSDYHLLQLRPSSELGHVTERRGSEGSHDCHVTERRGSEGSHDYHVLEENVISFKSEKKNNVPTVESCSAE